MSLRIAALVVLLAFPKEPDVPAPDFWEPLPVPQAGEWLFHHREEGQTFAEYKAADPTRATRIRRRIYIRPWLTRPPAEPALLPRIATTLEGFFGRPVTILEPEPLPQGAYDPTTRRLSVLHLAARLLRELPADGLFLLAVTDRDLALGDEAVTHGWGSLRRRVGVLSSWRIDHGPDLIQRRRRLLSLAVHEAGHMLSLAHCTFFRCLMNGAISPREADRRPMHLCPVCRAKLCWNLGAESLARYDRWAEALQKAGLPKDAAAARGASRATRQARDKP